MEQFRHERTQELTREVLRDLKCLEGARVRCCWIAGRPEAPKELLIPAVYIMFEHVGTLAPALCISFPTKGFATGSPIHDEPIRYVIRDRVEKYLKMINCEPADMRLDEENYA